MTCTKYAVPLLALVLLMPAGMGGALAQTPGESAGVAGNTSPYVELLEQDEAYQNLTDAQKQVILDDVTAFITEDTPHEKARNALIEEVSRIALEIRATDDEAEIEALNARLDMMEDELKEFGIVKSTELLADEDLGSFFNDLAKKQREMNSAPTAGAGGIILLNGATLFFPAFHGLVTTVLYLLSGMALGFSAGF